MTISLIVIVALACLNIFQMVWCFILLDRLAESKISSGMTAGEAPGHLIIREPSLKLSPWSENFLKSKPYIPQPQPGRRK
jgi:hypothetical protein